MKIKIIGILICMLLIGTVLPVSGTVDLESNLLPQLFGNTLYVGGSGPGNYTKIQDAINDANDGDTVYVYSGFYVEISIYHMFNAKLFCEIQSKVIYISYCHISWI